MTGRWRIHRRANPADDRLLGIMDPLQLCAVSPLHQPRRGSTNATYLPKDPRYGHSHIDYVMVSCRWATSAHKCSVKWGVSCQRWGRRYDDGLVSCVWVCRTFSQRKRDTHIDYAPFMAKDGGELRERFDARVKQHMTATLCDTAVASASLERLTKCLTTAAQETLHVKQYHNLRKRCVSNRTLQLYEQRRRDFANLSEYEIMWLNAQSACHLVKTTESTSMGYSTISRRLREGKQAVVTCIDYSAAFDTNSHMFLDKALAEAGVGAKVRRIVHAIFAAATGVVCLRHPEGTMTLSEPFDIPRGVLQGDTFSPVAFIAGLDRIFRIHDLHNPGVRLALARLRPSCRSSSTRMTPRSSMRMLRQRLPE